MNAWLSRNIIWLSESSEIELTEIQ